MGGARWFVTNLTEARMRKLLRDAWLLAFVMLMSFGAISACGSGDAQCHERCQEHSDCEGSLLCLNTTSGFQCLPNFCDTCFADGLTCYTTDSGSVSDGTFVCASPRCG